MKKGLYVVATPIGNLGDISERAKEVLSAVNYVACEDTRVSKKLFSLLGISLDKNFMTYEDHSEEERAQGIIDIITTKDEAVALISDAGSPLISDPGYKLVRKCREQEVAVYTVPGCCAVVSALQLSGLPTNRFMFAGFIPNKDKARSDLFKELAPVDTTLVFYETAPRLQKTLAAAAEIFGNREMAVAREITKMYEECVNGTAAELAVHFEQNQPKGEIVLISSITKKGLEELKKKIWEILQKIPKQKNEHVETFVIDERDKTSLEITREEDGAFRVSGGLIDNMIRGIVLSDMESFAYFQRRLEQDGILEKLREKGAKDGDTIRIKDVEFIFTD